jgi:hypothetical protein
LPSRAVRAGGGALGVGLQAGEDGVADLPLQRAPLLSHATARPRQAGTSFGSQTQDRSAGGSGANPTGTSQRYGPGSLPSRPDPATPTHNQAARRAFSLTYSITQRDAADRRSPMPTVDSVWRDCPGGRRRARCRRCCQPTATAGHDRTAGRDYGRAEPTGSCGWLVVSRARAGGKCCDQERVSKSSRRWPARK